MIKMFPIISDFFGNQYALWVIFQLVFFQSFFEGITLTFCFPEVHFYRPIVSLNRYFLTKGFDRGLQCFRFFFIGTVDGEHQFAHLGFGIVRRLQNRHRIKFPIRFKNIARTFLFLKHSL